jgi:thioredoxin 1
MASANVKHISDSNFDGEVLKSPTPVLVDFWAPWCGPCKAIAPVLDELADEYAGKLKVVKMNVDENPETPARYGVRGIPNLLIIKSGQVKDQIVGAVPKGHLVRAVDAALA